MEYKMKLDINKKDKYFVYKHYFYNENNEEVVFYIGKGTSDRHFCLKRNKLWEDIVYNQLNGEYYIKIIKYFDLEKDALEYEKKLQKEYYLKGQCLGCKDVINKNFQKNNKKAYKLIRKNTIVENNNFIVISSYKRIKNTRIRKNHILEKNGQKFFIYILNKKEYGIVDNTLYSFEYNARILELKDSLLNKKTIDKDCTYKINEEELKMFLK